MGIVNLFADMTYEGGASINGPFLGTLGASAAAVSIIAGAGEFVGYSLRSVAGYVADRTGKHWPITFLGYAINLFAVPAMALAGSWHVAAALSSPSGPDGRSGNPRSRRCSRTRPARLAEAGSTR